MTQRQPGQHRAAAISIHMPHTWHDGIQISLALDDPISIHMPHTWHDSPMRRIAMKTHDFNPHATYVA